MIKRVIFDDGFEAEVQPSVSDVSAQDISIEPIADLPGETEVQGALETLASKKAYREYADFSSLPVAGVSEAIYLTLDDNLLYRWNNSTYEEIGQHIEIDTDDTFSSNSDLKVPSQKAVKTATERDLLEAKRYAIKMAIIFG